MKHLIAVALLALPAPALADAMARAIAAAGVDCAAQGGRMELADGMAQAVDLTGDGTADDAVVWEYGGFCAPDRGFVGGSGGAPLHVAVGDTVATFGAGSWVIQDVAFPIEGGEPGDPVRVLLLARHGSACDAYGAALCVQAVTWDAGEGRFLTVEEPPAP